ncbi:MAG: hypothetical protein ACRBN8_11700 [Nannocystales bacterium]
MSNGQFSLDDDDFWDNPTKNKAQLMKGLMRGKRSCVVLDAPRHVPTPDRKTLPVAGIHVRTLRENYQIDQEKHLLAVAVDTEDNTARVGVALGTGKTPGGRPVPPQEDPGEGFVGNMFVCDVGRQLGVPLEGRQAVTMMVREYLSNTCTLEVGPSMHAFEDDEVRRYVEARRGALQPPRVRSVWPPLPQISGAITRALQGKPDPFPNYKQRDDSPPVPDDVGVEFTIDRVTEAIPGRRCLLRGAFRLPVTAHERVGVDADTGRLRDVGCPGATAVVGIHLVATGTTLTGPFVFPLRVPSFDVLESSGDTTATGFFNIDLFGLDAMPKRAGTYFFTAFSREVTRGPVYVGLAPSVGVSEG